MRYGVWNDFAEAITDSLEGLMVFCLPGRFRSATFSVLCGFVKPLPSLNRKTRAVICGLTSKVVVSLYSSIHRSITVLSFLVMLTGYASSQTQTSAKPRRDPAAISILQNELNALGGAEAWKNVHGIKVHGSRRTSKEAPEESFTWEDHWDKRYKFYRDTFPGGKRKRFLQDADRQPQPVTDSSSTSTTVKKPLSPPEMDPVDVLLLHVPAAAIFHVLNHAEYSVTVVDSPTKDVQSKKECARIRKQVAPSSQPVDVVLCSVLDSHLPVVAQIELRNLMNPGHPLYEEIRYSGFAPINGVLLPTKTEFKRPTGQIHSLVFHDLVVNPTPEPTAFGGGAQ
jgi:hypothetical protein